MSNELSNFDIIDIIKDLKLDHCFGGVYSKDQLPKDLMRTKFYIVNMQDHYEGEGTHWIVFYYIKPLTSIFFDSFGFPPPEDIDEEFLHNKQDKQEAYNGFLKLFKLDTSQNDKVLQELIYN